jgi:DNA-binding beta-propeller fold protein YncE
VALGEVVDRWRPDTAVLALSPSYGADLVAAMLRGGLVAFLNVRTEEVVLAQEQQGAYMRGVAIDPRTGRVAASTSEDGTLKLWDVKDGAALDTLVVQRALGEAPAGVAFAPDGKRLFVGTFAGVVLELVVRR